MAVTANIPVLGKSIQVLEALASGTSHRSVAELARGLGIAPATCWRILKTLERADWVRPESGGGYGLSLGLLPLVEPLRRYESLASRWQGVLEELARATGLSVKLSVAVGDEAATVARAESPRAMSLSGRVGARFPLAVGSSGASLLSVRDDAAVEAVIAGSPESVWRHQSARDVRARVRQVRRTGVCADRGSYHPQVYSLSTCVRDAVRGEVVAITLLGLPDEMTPRAVKAWTALLKRAAKPAGRRAA